MKESQRSASLNHHQDLEKTLSSVVMFPMDI